MHPALAGIPLSQTFMYLAHGVLLGMRVDLFVDLVDRLNGSSFSVSARIIHVVWTVCLVKALPSCTENQVYHNHNLPVLCFFFFVTQFSVGLYSPPLLITSVVLCVKDVCTMSCEFLRPIFTMLLPVHLCLRCSYFCPRLCSYHLPFDGLLATGRCCLHSA